MSLYERLCGRNEQGGADENLQKIAIDQFSAMLNENTYGSFDRLDIINIVGMDAGEVIQLDFMLSKGANPAARREFTARFRNALHLAEGNIVGYGLPSQLESVIAGM